MAVSLFLYGLIVFGLLIAELRENSRAQSFFKPLAAIGFILLAIQFGALESRYGLWIFSGLIFCALGDVFLLSRKSQPLFILGMAAFALGHLAYIGGLSYVSHDMPIKPWMVIAPIAASLGFYISLYSKLESSMKVSVAIYSLIIAAMVIFALTSQAGYAIIAAIIFAISDMFMARDRFVKPDPKNALAITPLYFGAQALFALSTQALGV